MSGAFAGERAVVIGAGVAGVAAAEALLAEGAQVRVTDIRPASELAVAARLEATGVEVRAGGHDATDLDDATLVVVSPGVSPDIDIVARARERKLPVWGEMELGARLASVPYLAVTGTNGKTTTTGMVAAALEAAGHDAVACGNIGRPFPTAARERHDVLVVEVSSFQLESQTSFHPVVSVLLNVAPDHLDRHGSLERYEEAKARVFANQGAGDTHVGNRDDDRAATLSAAAPCRRVWFRRGEPGQDEVGYVDGVLVSRIGAEASIAPVEGDRAGYREDAAAAAAAAIAFGVDPPAVARGLATYRPALHRGEVVVEVAGVRFIDNSKATNVHAAIAAIDSVPGAVLIAGGRAKGQDLSALSTRADRVLAVVALGESADEVLDAFRGTVPTERAGTIEEATRLAFAHASPGGAVLLAPACASWDQFADYVERGERFADAARSLAGGVSAGAGA
ncbi:MAG TPA: UDP-N-acetylmuramoyl-L-alanine--D-glutamate ligase [Actinomycetota bacterium]